MNVNRDFLICGIDEAGRGPLAGPVVAAAVILPADYRIDGLADSKKLTETRRRKLAAELRHHAWIGLGIAEPEEIDRLNILHATMTAMRRACLNLPALPHKAEIDGNRIPQYMPCEAEAIVKGDSKVAAISAASIIAKTVRDDLMLLAEARFPGYGFAGHKGYPSPSHKDALIRLGPCPIHRRSYAPVRQATESAQSGNANHCG
ncbi:ribonuclease HII [Maricaulis sp.]|uniref:ribonuclease HII n=1 Tax=Maricaulis sp. TaxID=1486257 RepID=UPI0026048A5D|nr:ribonuclease HII [Maricaulis sp.]